MHFIEKEVERLVKKHKTRNPFELCHLENIQCIFLDMNNEINGLYQYVARNRFIYINKNISIANQYRTCGHELGHAVLHKKHNCAFLKNYTYLNTNKYEREADMFAVILAIPTITKEQLMDKTLEEIACDMEVPKELLELRINVLKLS